MHSLENSQESPPRSRTRRKSNSSITNFKPLEEQAFAAAHPSPTLNTNNNSLSASFMSLQSIEKVGSALEITATDEERKFL